MSATITHIVLKMKDVGLYRMTMVPLDIIALVGVLRYEAHHSIPEIIKNEAFEA